MKIFFSGSISGGLELQEWYSLILNELANYGEVLSEFSVDQKLTSYSFDNITDEEIYSRDIKLIEDSEIVFADVTVPSLGVGYEVACAEKLGKKVFCLYHKVEGKKTSAMIKGNKNLKTFPYETKEEIEGIVKNIFNNYEK